MRTSWFVFAVLLLAAGAVAGISRVSSDRAENFHREAIVLLEDAEHVTVLSDSFERGWSTSRAAIHIEVAGPVAGWVREHLEQAGLEHARMRVGLRLESELSHGPEMLLASWQENTDAEPLAAVAVSTLSLDRESARDLTDTLGEVPPISFVTEVQVSGAHQTSLVWEAASFSREGGEAGWQAEWRGLDGVVFRTADGSIEGHLAGDGLTWTTTQGRLEIGGAALDFRGGFDATGEWIGTLDQHLNDVEWVPAGTLPGDADPAPGDDPDAGSIGTRWAAAEVRVDQSFAQEPGSGRIADVDVRVSDAAFADRAIDVATVTTRWLLDGEVPPEAPKVVPDPRTATDPMVWLWFGLNHAPTWQDLVVEAAGSDGSIRIVGELRAEVTPAHVFIGVAEKLPLQGELRFESRGDLGEVFGLGPERFAGWADSGLGESIRGGDFVASEGTPTVESESDESVRRAHFQILAGEFLPPDDPEPSDDGLATGEPTEGEASVPAAQSEDG